jgi:hypothetical protein
MYMCMAIFIRLSNVPGKLNKMSSVTGVVFAPNPVVWLSEKLNYLWQRTPECKIKVAEMLMDTATHPDFVRWLTISFFQTQDCCSSRINIVSVSQEFDDFYFVISVVWKEEQAGTRGLVTCLLILHDGFWLSRYCFEDFFETFYFRNPRVPPATDHEEEIRGEKSKRRSIFIDRTQNHHGNTN